MPSSPDEREDDWTGPFFDCDAPRGKDDTEAAGREAPVRVRAASGSDWIGPFCEVSDGEVPDSSQRRRSSPFGLDFETPWDDGGVAGCGGCAANGGAKMMAERDNMNMEGVAAAASANEGEPILIPEKELFQDEADGVMKNGCMATVALHRPNGLITNGTTTRVPQAPTNDNHVPLSMQGWIASLSSLSNDEYLAKAARLAVMLADHVNSTCLGNDQQSSAGSPKTSLRSVTAENIIVLLESRSDPAVRGVRLNNDNTASMDETYLLDGLRLWDSSREVCSKLGGIFLELFSRGASRRQSTMDSAFGASRQGAIMGEAQNNGGPARSVVDHLNWNKRPSLAEPADESLKLLRAKNLLRDAGIPTSICTLVSDLLDAAGDHREEPRGGGNTDSIPLTSLEELGWDLSRMNESPSLYLTDGMCPERALEDARIFGSDDGRLFGRDGEIETLMNAKERVVMYVRGMNAGDCSTISRGVLRDFLCDAVFISGYAGCGKSSLLKHVTQSCSADEWFILECKFDKKSSAQIVLAQAFNDFFGGVSPGKVSKVCGRIFSTVDSQSVEQLFDLIPNLTKIFPLLASSKRTGSPEPISMDKVGSARKRLVALFDALFESLFMAGFPVLLSLDDIHWSDSFILEWMSGVLFNASHNTATSASNEVRRRGLLILGTFRSNEVAEKGIIEQTINVIKQNDDAKVTAVAVEELTQVNINRLLSEKLRLPLRYTRELSSLVHAKTRGNPFFIIQFIRTIVRNRMLEYSIKHRRWMWDYDVIDMQMISDGVAQLLTTRFSQLPFSLMQTLKIASCLGVQVYASTIDILNSRQELVLPFNMEDELNRAVKEGLMERAGPIMYQFSHDIIHSTIYGLMSETEKTMYHKTLGVALLNYAAGNIASVGDDPTIYLLAIDQINIYCKDAILDPEERSRYAETNINAAKYSIASSRFDEARSYIDSGMKLLGPGHWQDQYNLSLKLYEMSASVSCINGDIDTMATSLDIIFANVKSFEDSLTSSALRSKLLAASFKYTEALEPCLSCLAYLGEEFPQRISLPVVLTELSVIQKTLADISVEKMKRLPPLEDKTKLKAMQFLSMLCLHSIIVKPMLLPLVSHKMVRLTMSYGFCDESIIGIVSAGWTLFTFNSDTQLGYQIIRVGESLIKERSSNALISARLSGYTGWSAAIVEPVQSVLQTFTDQYNSGILTGDIEYAMLSRWSHCVVSFHVGVNLSALMKHLSASIKQAENYQQKSALYAMMSICNACMALTGDRVSADAVEIKSYKELDQIARHNPFLSFQNALSQITEATYTRDYLEVLKLSEQIPESQNRRVFETNIIFFGGIASLCLARQTHQAKWRVIGEKAMVKLSQMEAISTWNFENKSRLLQAEHHYLDGQLESAEDAYKASIVSARDHRFVNEEGLAHELYGIFCIENKMLDKGVEQLRLAANKYNQWGAPGKAEELKLFIETVRVAAIWNCYSYVQQSSYR